MELASKTEHNLSPFNISWSSWFWNDMDRLNKPSTQLAP